MKYNSYQIISLLLENDKEKKSSGYIGSMIKGAGKGAVLGIGTGLIARGLGKGKIHKHYAAGATIGAGIGLAKSAYDKIKKDK